MIAGKNIHKRYGAVEILKGVDMEINRGEVVSIVGPSGSGKSTLLHILGTLDFPDSGHIEISGTRIEFQPRVEMSPAPWWKRLINLVLDSFIIGLLLAGFATVFGFPLVADGRFSLTAVTDGFTPLAFVGGFAILVLYYTLTEGLIGRSVGKMLTGTKVVMESDGTKPSILNCLFRSLGRLIPAEFASFFASRPIGWHDGLVGTLVVNNRPYAVKLQNSLTRKEMANFRNRRIGFVFQFHHLLPEFTALENVCIPGWLTGRKKNEVKKEAERLLSILGLSHRLENKPNELSGGEQQRVAVARALINKPDIIFADEPTGNLDSANAKELHELFFELRNNFNQTFLIVTHNEELAQLSDRVLYMKDGRIV